jgi:hypothetical protein
MFNFQTSIIIVSTPSELVYMATLPVTGEKIMQPLREENNTGAGSA